MIKGAGLRGVSIVCIFFVDEANEGEMSVQVSTDHTIAPLESQPPTKKQKLADGVNGNSLITEDGTAGNGFNGGNASVNGEDTLKRRKEHVA